MARPNYGRLIAQGRIWIDAEGQVHRLRTMDPNHRANLIPFLRRSADAIKRVCAPEDPREPEDWLEHTPLMRRLVDLEQGRTLDERRATHERNRAHELATGYQKRRLVPSRDSHLDYLDEWGF